MRLSLTVRPSADTLRPRQRPIWDMMAAYLDMLFAMSTRRRIRDKATSRARVGACSRGRDWSANLMAANHQSERGPSRGNGAYAVRPSSPSVDQGGANADRAASAILAHFHQRPRRHRERERSARTRITRINHPGRSPANSWTNPTSSCCARSQSETISGHSRLRRGAPGTGNRR